MTLKQYGIIIYAVYVCLIVGLTALAAYLYRDRDYLFLTALAIPATLLTMPVIEYFHLVLLILSYTVLLLFKTSIFHRSMTITSFVLVYLAGFLFPFSHLTNYIIPFGLLMLWIPLLYHSLSLNEHHVNVKMP